MSILTDNSPDLAELLKNNFIIFHFLGNNEIINKLSIPGDHENCEFHFTGMNQKVSKERN